MTTDPLALAEALTAQMLSFALDNQWREVNALQDERDKLLAAWSQSSSAYDPDQLRITLDTIFKHNQQLIELSQRHKTDLSQQMKAINTGKNAIKAYNNC